VPFALAQWTFLAPVAEAIRRALPHGGRLLDIGCGSAIFSSLLAHHGFEVVGIDEEEGIVCFAREMVEYFRTSVRVERGSAFRLEPYYGRFDLVYSLGVVEHFDRDVTVRLLREQARCAPCVLAAVPTRYTKYSGVPTDERFYRRREVIAIVREAGLQVVDAFVYGQVPTTLAINAQRLLPKVLYRSVAHVASYGMGICCVGRRP
jgi:SAM-dependent methyltransferase